MAFEAAHVEAAQETPETAPATLAPTHSVPEIDTVAVPKEAPVVKVEAPVAAPVVKIANPGYPGAYLKAGSKGDAVKYIQQQLKVAVTGVFDAKTVQAVKALQKKHGLTADAIVGPKTWAKLG
jgi:peptidoglycan hydrolase-like protein with peptidoglycan-binding domain